MHSLRLRLKTNCPHSQADSRPQTRPKTGTRPEPSRACASALGLALFHLLTFATIACSENASDEGMLRGRGPLVSEFATITACETAIYRGSETTLYSNRPYHTEAAVATVQGLAFCRGARHGTNLWILEITRPTTLIAFGNQAFWMERRGWKPADAPLLVQAAGVPLDRIYTRRFEPGHFVIRQGFTRSAPVVFWDTEAARISAAIPGSTESAR